MYDTCPVLLFLKKFSTPIVVKRKSHRQAKKDFKNNDSFEKLFQRILVN